MADRAEMNASWSKVFLDCLELDAWGQVEEAIDGYDRLSASISTENTENNLRLTPDEKATLTKMAVSLNLRAEALRTSVHSPGTLTLDQIKKLIPVVETILIKPDVAPFPLTLPSSALRSLSVATDPNAPDIMGATESEEGSLLQPPVLEIGEEGLSIMIDKIGFKDTSGCMNPFMTVSVADAHGALIESAQDTPSSNRIKPNYILFGQTVHIQTPLSRLEDNCAIFFELKHYKPKKKKISTKAWCFMERDEIKPGAIALEIYKKPTDFKRHTTRLLTVKPLYLHLDLSIRKS
eukprot:jgi/Mesvir1/1423/Mv14421-RA.1